MVNCECYERQRKKILWLNIGLDLKILCLMTQKKPEKHDGKTSMTNFIGYLR